MVSVIFDAIATVSLLCLGIFCRDTPIHLIWAYGDIGKLSDYPMFYFYLFITFVTSLALFRDILRLAKKGPAVSYPHNVNMNNSACSSTSQRFVGIIVFYLFNLWTHIILGMIILSFDYKAGILLPVLLCIAILALQLHATHKNLLWLRRLYTVNDTWKDFFKPI